MKWENKQIQRLNLLDGNYHRKNIPYTMWMLGVTIQFPNVPFFSLSFLYFPKKWYSYCKTQVKLWEIFYGPLFKNNDLTKQKTVLVCLLYKAHCKSLYAHKKIYAGMGLLWPCRNYYIFYFVKKINCQNEYHYTKIKAISDILKVWLLFL